MNAPTWSCFPLLNDSIRKYFRRLPTTTVWTGFRKYARRMREFSQHGTQDSVPGGFPGHTTLDRRRSLVSESENSSFVGNQEVVHFIHLVPFPRITSISLTFQSDLPATMITSTLTALPTLCPNTKRSDDRRRRFQNASRHKSE